MPGFKPQPWRPYWERRVSQRVEPQVERAALDREGQEGVKGVRFRDRIPGVVSRPRVIFLNYYFSNYYELSEFLLISRYNRI